MDNGYPYFTKNIHQEILIMSHVKFWWMDEKWHQHNIMIVIIGELHNSWKGIVAIEMQPLQFMQLFW
jgi:hypothetical protein